MLLRAGPAHEAGAHVGQNPPGLSVEGMAPAAASAGGDAPSPEAPAIADLKTLTALSGNEQLKEVASRVPALRAALIDWKATAASIAQRLPAWILAERLVALGATAQQPSLDAIRAANHKLVDWKRVRSYVVARSEFPKTASMKVKREQLAAALRAQVANPEPLPSSAHH